MLVEADLRDYTFCINSISVLLITCKVCWHKQTFYCNGNATPMSDLTSWILDHEQEDTFHKTMTRKR